MLTVQMNTLWPSSQYKTSFGKIVCVWWSVMHVVQIQTYYGCVCLFVIILKVNWRRKRLLNELKLVKPVKARQGIVPDIHRGNSKCVEFILQGHSCQPSLLPALLSLFAWLPSDSTILLAIWDSSVEKLKDLNIHKLDKLRRGQVNWGFI